MSNLRSERASRVLDDGEIVIACNSDYLRQISRHAHLVHAHNCRGSCGNGGLKLGGIEIERLGLDVNKHRYCTTLPDDIGAGNESMADSDDLVPRLHADCEQSEVERNGAIRYCARMGRPDKGGELRLEGSDLRTLR